MREYAVPDGQLRVWFDPATHFSAVGALGIPLVPMRVRRRDLTEFDLAIKMSLSAEHNFSFAALPV